MDTSNYVLISPSSQYKFLKRSFRPDAIYYTLDTSAYYVYLNLNYITKVTISVGVFASGKETIDIHLIEFESAGKVATIAIDDKGLSAIGLRNPNQAFDGVLK